MTEEFAACDKPAELVAAQSWNVVDPAAFRLGYAVPTSERGARSVNGKGVILLEIDRGRFDASAVDRYPQLGTQD